MFTLNSIMLVGFNTFTPQINNANRSEKKYPNLSPLRQDTVSFSCRTPKDLMSLTPRRIIMVCKKALKDGIKIGEGQEAIAYKMEDYPQYCIRREKTKSGRPSDFKFDTKLNKYDKVNHVVAKLDDGTQLMRFIPGIPLKITHRDTVDGKKVKETVKGLVANNFPETSFKKVISQIEDAKLKGIDFDRKGENLHVEPLSQEMICIDFSPNFHDIEYNPISYIYSALDVDGTEHAPKIFGKLCKAYAQRLFEVPANRLNLEHLDINFYHRGFMDDAFNLYPDREGLAKTQKLLEELIEAKKDPSNPKDYLKYMVEEFKNFIDETIIPLKKRSFFDDFELE